MTVEQMHTADRALFKWLREETECGGIRADAGVRPIETKMEEVLANRIDEVTSILTNRPLAVTAEGRVAPHGQGTKRNREAEDDGGGAGTKDAKLLKLLEAKSAQIKGLENKLAKRKTDDSSSSLWRTGGRGTFGSGADGPFGRGSDVRDKPNKGNGRKGGGKGQNEKDGFVPMPPDLHGLNPKYEGEKMCFGFNLGECNKVRPGEKCKLGWHRCMAWGCASTRHGFKVSGGGHRK